MKKILPIILTAIVVVSLALTGCGGGNDDPKPTDSPTTRPTVQATQTVRPTNQVTVQPSPSPSASESPNTSESAMPTTGASEEPGDIEGFMEGGIVDPKSVPELTQLLSDSEEFGDMSIQSITYKTYEGHQAYYVILQGEGAASRSIYVLSNNSILIPSEENNAG